MWIYFGNVLKEQRKFIVDHRWRQRQPAIDCRIYIGLKIAPWGLWAAANPETVA